MTMNLKELSVELGLSQTTVSRALNGYPEVSETTRRRVFEAAARHGYRPSPAARRLATGRSYALGIVFPVDRDMLLDPLFVAFLAGVCETASRHLFNLVISPTPAGEEIATYERMARDGTADAVIISAPRVDDRRLQRLREIGFPHVVHGRPAGYPGTPFLDIDNEGAFYQATRYLGHLGHRRIALLNGEASMTFAVDRRAGMARAAAEAGIPLRDDLIVHAPMTVDNGYRATAQALASAEPPTAVLCGSVLLALGALRAISEAGLSVPDDVSLIAHDDDMPAFPVDHMLPPLTTTRSSIRSAGVRIAEIALDAIRGVGPLAEDVWPVDLIVRGSTGVAPSRRSPSEPPAPS